MKINPKGDNGNKIGLAWRFGFENKFKKKLAEFVFGNFFRRRKCPSKRFYQKLTPLRKAFLYQKNCSKKVSLKSN
jgi:hypothetical protein